MGMTIVPDHVGHWEDTTQAIVSFPLRLDRLALEHVNSSLVHVYVTQTPAGTLNKTFASYGYGCNCGPRSTCSKSDCVNKAKYGSTSAGSDVVFIVHPDPKRPGYIVTCAEVSSVCLWLYL
ncbi:hypothetical protein PHYSODRAFT_340904 [Phytophthora sojae]|uniref:Uncharacterized protein n=1 Tax=Phytophthora sojae (strain P6497) TaxID=1094619 RepID=G5ABG4_PHYSP|nr:hypothetical protein PHYSODRAFT_340904 [Phytophthora sojae]EGZ06689.1 hypothetical protein PHYSODRAFT_340904 [Phytophthora sojae]|eukprot:XP_009537453.1 hypothetical protein PHYSODRAFT_340904 [Phytophthora sojae]